MLSGLIKRNCTRAGIIALAATPMAYAAEVIVDVSGAPSDQGKVGCALFDSKSGFPMKPAPGAQLWAEIEEGEATCRYTNLSGGDYAVAVSHDANGNQKTDTNVFGIPKEAWGVSNNIRPRMRAPRFSEAQFTLQEDERLVLKVAIKK